MFKGTANTVATGFREDFIASPPKVLWRTRPASLWETCAR
ncbi:hypothetical protein ACCUM_2483 [Candidatus Accumulibacter phosphatis]|uniref:Uncharacterized protein n=1 Tax=Candidatus Accumulibacter phosphatis TaxID=327160 RepID=A0A5S4EI25_9PROT|nr:hypothetical protein ACCUM_2483 [Candidatus Accumulibacter phosphatis]